MCYYYNYVLYKRTDNYVDKIEERNDFGPFLGSQLPDFTRLATVISQDVLSFAMNQYFYMCAVVKRNDRVVSLSTS
uniref:Sema domain-containing protein n=1 Tax=Panagrellus redivivus TaxID=6233 RepID=A0A7E4UX79_PANRE